MTTPTGRQFTVTVAWNGQCPRYSVDAVGTVPAAMTTTLALAHFRPDVVISAGTCGGFQKRGGTVGKVYLSSTVGNHDREIQIPGFDVYGSGILTCQIVTPQMAQDLGVELGHVSTGNCLNLTEDHGRLIEGERAVCKEMEAAGIAWVCLCNQKPFFGVKCVTDIVDCDQKPTGEQFLANLQLASQKLMEAMVLVVPYVADLSL